MLQVAMLELDAEMWEARNAAVPQSSELTDSRPPSCAVLLIIILLSSFPLRRSVPLHHHSGDKDVGELSQKDLCVTEGELRPIFPKRARSAEVDDEHVDAVPKLDTGSHRLP